MFCVAIIRLIHRIGPNIVAPEPGLTWPPSTWARNMGRESPEVAALFAVLASCSSISLSGIAFRSATVKYANESDFVSGAGAAYYGARWNPPRIRAIYASLDPITATKEAFQQFSKFGFAPAKIKPRVIAGIKFKLKRVLDLTDSRIRRKIGFSLDELLQEDWQAIQRSGVESWTQAIGRGSMLAGFEALLAPSAQDKHGKNVIIFPTELQPHSYVKLLESKELPPHPSTWPS